MTALRQGQQIRRTFTAELTFVADDQVDVRMMTGERARDGDIWIPSGVILKNYIANPIFLWRHDDAVPVGTASNIQEGVALPAGMTRSIFLPSPFGSVT